MGKFMPKGPAGPETDEIAADVKKPTKKGKKKKGKKFFAHDRKTKDGKTGGMLKGNKGKKVVPAPPGKGKRPVPPQFAKGKKSEKVMAAKSRVGSIAEDIFG